MMPFIEVKRPSQLRAPKSKDPKHFDVVVRCELRNPTVSQTLAPLAGCRALQRISADLRLQLREVREDVGLAPQFVGDHRWLTRYRRNHRNADTPTLDCFDKGAESSIAGEQDHLVDLTGEIHGIDGKLDVHVSLDLAATAGVRELLHRLGDYGVAIVTEPICQRPERGIFLIFNDCRVVERAQQRTAAFKFFEEALVVDVEAERPRSCVQVGAIDKKRDVIGSERHRW
jgi:hypothetical protein